MNYNFEKLNKNIIKCTKCPRLVKFRNSISIKKRKQNINDIYWGKPVPGFGDLKAELMIIGLAPAAHGGNRTGRAFTGDKSGDFLFKCLYKVGISNIPYSKNKNDNLKLKSTYITNILKCVPPADKPLTKELNNCSNFFNDEILLLKNLKVIMTLGKVSFDNCFKIYKKKIKLNKKFTFQHGKIYPLPDNKFLIACYHPSPRNVNTKIISAQMMINLLNKVKKIAKI